MKLPNGYGTVRKLSGKRRKPWIVEKTVGWTIDEETKSKKQVRVTIGYYVTRQEGLQALADYNSNPYDLNARNVTFRQLYELWSKRKFDKVSDRTKASYEAASKYLEPIMDSPIQQIKTFELQNIIDSCPLSSSTKSNIKVVMNGAFEYAMQNDIVDRNYSQYVEVVETDPTYERKVFTLSEINALWDRKDRFDIRILLILLYTGMRVNELLKMPRECFNIDENYLDIRQAKNKTSIRKVPVHKKILPLLLDFYNCNGELLIMSDSGCKVSYNNFATRNMIRMMEELNTTHKIHDTRHTFITQAKHCKFDDLYLKKIVGHSPDNITDKVYTHITIQDLNNEINRLIYK